MKETTETTTMAEKEEFKQSWLSCTGTLLSVLFSNPEYDLETAPAYNALENTLITLFADVCKTTGAAWKAKINNVAIHNGGRAFLIVVDTPVGQIIDHCDEKHWDRFDIDVKIISDEESWNYSKKSHKITFDDTMKCFASLI